MPAVGLLRRNVLACFIQYYPVMVYFVICRWYDEGKTGPPALQGGIVMKKKFALTLLLLFLCLFALPIPAFADTGPKPSVVVTFQGLKQKGCYVTLLAQEESTGPYSAYNAVRDNKYIEDGVPPQIWQKFVDYKDADGYHFLQFCQKLGDDGVFTWGYHPPQKFKILLYSPDDDTFMASAKTYEPYAFVSYFTVDASTIANPGSSPSSGSISSGTVQETISAKQSYDYAGEARSLLVRTLITIAVELLIALPFGYLAMRQLGFIAIVNVATQVILNVLLNLVNYNQGWTAYFLTYCLLEILVIWIEAFIYSHSATLVKYSRPGRKPDPVMYAVTANIASCVAGLVLYFHFPMAF